MQETDVIRSLAALAQEVRLRVFRALVVAGQEGLTPGGLSEQLGIAPNTLSFHLKELTHAGLRRLERRQSKLSAAVRAGRQSRRDDENGPHRLHNVLASTSEPICCSSACFYRVYSCRLWHRKCAC